MTEKRILALILILFIGLGFIYALVTPAFEASDELWHYPMVRHLADGSPLPVQTFDPAQAGPWRQEASQPPLYYYLGAALTFWIDTGDMAAVRQLNPHVDNGRITSDGNINLAVHDPTANPWQGSLLAVRIVRLFSVLLGAATVYLTYRIGKEMFPDRPEIALGAAGVNAFMPMFLFISGAVNNDNLAIPLASLALLLMIQQVKRAKLTIGNSQFTIHYFTLGIIIGLAILTKEGTFGLLPLAWGAAFVAGWKRLTVNNQQSTANSQQSTINNQRLTNGWFLVLKAFAWSWVDFVVVLSPVVLIAGWWYWRNIQLYGDFLGWNAFIAVLGSRAQPASLAQLWDERMGFLMSYWGLFGGVNVPMWGWIYAVLNGVLVIGVLGFMVFVIQDLRLMIKVGAFRLQSLIFNLLELIADRFPLTVSFLFSGAVVYGLVQWATTTWSSQGRLVFAAISTLNLLLVTGLVGWLPPKTARRVVVGLVGFLLVAAALAPWLWIRPAYRPETYQQQVYAPIGYRVDFGEQMRLAGFAILPPDVSSTAVQPGDAVDVVLEWEAVEPMARNWSVFVHLIDPVLGVPIAQRDMYPGQGLRPTTFLRPGEKVTNVYRLTIPETAVAPANLLVSVGVYDFATGERLQTAAGEDSVVLAVLD
ncbi:MAG: glycosyltransferase family 39 protein, partial [Anaerolineae bacterium]